jgi:hypothetical protein
MKVKRYDKRFRRKKDLGEALYWTVVGEVDYLPMPQQCSVKVTYHNGEAHYFDALLSNDLPPHGELVTAVLSMAES